MNIVPSGEIRDFYDLTCKEFYSGNGFVAAIHHFLSTFNDIRNPKILEIGGSTLDLAIPTSSQILEECFNHRIYVNDVYKQGSFPFGSFIEGDFLKKETRSTIEGIIGGKPDIIVSKMVFVTDLLRYSSNVHNLSTSSPNLDNDLANTAYDFLSENGYLITCSGNQERIESSFLRELNPILEYERVNTKVFYKSK